MTTRLAAIVIRLTVSVYGHFGKAELTWEE
ncbi:methionine adenosyltransferase [Blautia schinkii]|nr:methionine adenosyltransferase [Blautia schinkii]